MAELAGLLAAVEDRPPDESGAFLVDDDGDGQTVGSVFVETGRVCWAAAPGRSGRLRDLLHRHSARQLADAELDDAFAACRDAQRPLGELLVERGMVSDDGLRAALKQHTVESLIAQCDGVPRPVTWVPHRRRGYSARFTFTPVELLAAAGAQLYPAEAPSVVVELPGASTIGSFAIGDEELPVALWASGSAASSVRDLLGLGDWAAAALAVCNGFSPAAMERAIAKISGPAAIAWRSSRRLVHAAVIDEPGDLASAVADLAWRGMGAVLSARIPTTAF